MNSNLWKFTPQWTGEVNVDQQLDGAELRPLNKNMIKKILLQSVERDPSETEKDYRLKYVNINDSR